MRHSSKPDSADTESFGVRTGIAVGVAALLLLVLSVVLFNSSSEDLASPADVEEVAVPTPRDVATPSPTPTSTAEIPAALEAVAEFRSDPSAGAIAGLFEVVGGLDGLEIATATGAFDVVTFDPLQPEQLLAAQRTGYGDARNEDRNEAWRIGEQGLTQTLVFGGTEPHDFLHYNPDGTTTIWFHPGGPGFAPRVARTVDRNGAVVAETTDAMYASRFAVDDGTVFALTGEPDWYAPQASPYLSLVADDGESRTRLAPGEDFAWLDVPMAGVVVAYPQAPPGETAAWDSGSLAPLPAHPLAGQGWARAAVSADGSVGLAVTLGEELVAFDPATGNTKNSLGLVNIDAVERPITVSADGTLAVVTEATGRVSMWNVSQGELAMSIDADASIPRWLPTTKASRVVAVVSPDATRLALPVAAQGRDGAFWRIIDIDPESWVRRACAIAGRALTTDEKAALGIETSTSICQ